MIGRQRGLGTRHWRLGPVGKPERRGNGDPGGKTRHSAFAIRHSEEGLGGPVGPAPDAWGCGRGLGDRMRRLDEPRPVCRPLQRTDRRRVEHGVGKVANDAGAKGSPPRPSSSAHYRLSLHCFACWVYCVAQIRRRWRDDAKTLAIASNPNDVGPGIRTMRKPRRPSWMGLMSLRKSARGKKSLRSNAPPR